MSKIFRAAPPYRLQQDFCVYSRSKATAQHVKLRVRASARGQSQRQHSRSNDISLRPRARSFTPPVVVAFLCFSDRLVAPCGKAVVPQTFLSVVSPSLSHRTPPSFLNHQPLTPKSRSPLNYANPTIYGATR